MYAIDGGRVNNNDSYDSNDDDYDDYLNVYCMIVNIVAFAAILSSKQNFKW